MRKGLLIALIYIARIALPLYIDVMKPRSLAFLLVVIILLISSFNLVYWLLNSNNNLTRK